MPRRRLARPRLGQPPVVGEMIPGVALGPSLFGLLAPTPQTQLFPAVVATLTATPMFNRFYDKPQAGSRRK